LEAWCAKRKSAPTKDLSYRPPRSAKAKAEKSNLLKKSGQPEDGSRFHTDSPAQRDVPDGAQPPIKVQKDTIPQAGNVELHEIKQAGDAPKSAKIEAAKTGSLNTPDQLEDGDNVHIKCSAQDHISDSVQSSNLNEDITAQDDNVELQPGKLSAGVEAYRDEASWLQTRSLSLRRW
jgi:hypothetical protein